MIVDSLSVRNRPWDIDQMFGHDTAKGIIKGGIVKETLPRQILLLGETGLGKTTFARIVGALVNCQERKGHKICLSSAKKIKKGNLCASCELMLTGSHPDIHEINIANNRKIDEIRDIISMAEYNPTFNYRVFILDEFQEILAQSAKTLLKPVEEPPAHTMWLIASMEPDKVPESIRNRCTPIPLMPLTRPEIKALLKKVAKKEKIKLGKKAAKWITSMSGLRPRDALSILEALLLYTASEDKDELITVPDNVAKTLVSSGVLGSAPTALAILALLYSQSPLVFAFMQNGVTNDLIRDLYTFQDSVVAHIGYGNKTWKWKSVLKTVNSALSSKLRYDAYSLDIKYHIRLCALLGKALSYSRTMGDPGLALRQCCAEWWEFPIHDDEE